MSGEMEQELTVQCKPDGTQVGEGVMTPESINTSNAFGLLPKRVIPIIFLPGIMGTKLRLTPERQKAMWREDNVALNPDSKRGMVGFGRTKEDERQRLLDPAATEVDSLAPDASQKPWRAYSERAGVRPDRNSPYLRGDYLAGWPQYPSRKGSDRKACERGWGEIFYDSYATVLNRMESLLNAAFSSSGKLNPDWKNILGADPKDFAATTPGLPPITEDELREVVDDCMFPVHVCGYNWLQSNGESARKVAARIEAIMADYRKMMRRCEKVIVVTH